MVEDIRIWDFIQSPLEEAGHFWLDCDTSVLDDIAASWYARRQVLERSNSEEYRAFMDQVKRRHAIETGVVERMYEIDRGVTETLILSGFHADLLTHNDSNIPKEALLGHLSDHLDGLEFVFDIVKSNRAITVGFICELHQLVTRHQDFAEGRDQLGNKIRIPLLKGKFKERENNPSRPDVQDVSKVKRFLYCPPEHVDAEMDRLVAILAALQDSKVHPLIISAWVHHAFTTIHPFQDGNGRVVRLLASLVLIKEGLFPVTVSRDEKTLKYINALEEADQGRPSLLVRYFAEIQRKQIELALNIREVDSKVLGDVAAILRGKMQQRRADALAHRHDEIRANRLLVFNICVDKVNLVYRRLVSEFRGIGQVKVGSSIPGDPTKAHFYYKQIVNFAKQHNYFFNHKYPRGYAKLVLDTGDLGRYDIVFSIHHVGYDDATIAIGSFLEFRDQNEDESGESSTFLLEFAPHQISILDGPISQRNIESYIEDAVTASLAQIASQF